MAQLTATISIKDTELFKDMSDLLEELAESDSVVAGRYAGILEKYMTKTGGDQDE